VLGKILARVREVAPYAAVELILPGGSLLALLLWLYRRRRADGAAVAAISRRGWLASLSATVAARAADHIAGPEGQSQHDKGKHDQQQQDLPCQGAHLLAG
jgi:hypothetical protein